MLDYIRSIASRRRDAETGASAVEYGLLVALIAAVIVLAVFALGGLVRNTFSQTCDEIQTNAEIEDTECAPE
jgi:pilus assembly protein Flp/PilA